MSFLARRKSQRPGQDAAKLAESHAYEQNYKSSPTPSIRSTSTFRHRLSSFSILTPRRTRSKTSSTKRDASGGIGFSAPYRVTDSLRSDSPSPTPSLEEIRRPSGLGRRVSITACSLDQETDRYAHPKGLSGSHTARKGSISTPNLPLAVPILPEGLVRWDLSETEDTTEDGHTYEHPAVDVFARVPPELLTTVFAYVAREDLPALSRVCKSFLSPARILLYGNVDLIPIADQRRVDACIHLLASKRDLAKLVHRFACNSITDSRPVVMASPLPTVSLAIALSNMTELVSLKAPRFDPSSFFHTAFQLRSLTLLWETASVDDLQGMFAWLTTQPALTSLSFPRLVLDDRTADMLSGAGNALSESALDEPSGSEQSLLSFPFVSRLIPALNRLHGPSSMVAALAPGRPLSSVTMHIHSTIYKGLRPSTLMSVIAQVTTPLTHLVVRTTPRTLIDARSLERVLMAAGAELGAGLKTLEIESTLEDEVLFKQLYGVLARYRALYTLCIRRASAPPYLTPPPTPSSVPETPVSPASASPVRPRANTAIPTRTQERALLGQWSKQCRTLRTVVFPSGGRWRITEGVGGSIFTFIGTRQ